MAKKRSKKQWEEYKTEVAKIVGELKDHLFLSHWEIKMFFNEESLKYGENCNVAASCDASLNYYCAHLNFYPEHFEVYQNGDEFSFKHTVIHELCHILTDPLFDEIHESMTKQNEKYLNRIREQSTEHIATIVHVLLDSVDEEKNKYKKYGNKTIRKKRKKTPKKAS